MTFLPIPNYEGIYEISDIGEVRSVDRVIIGNDGIAYSRKGRLLKPSPHKDLEYLQVSLWKHNKGTSYYIHRLVAKVFLPNPYNLMEVNHKNGIRYDNTVNNLEWVTSSQNSQHAVDTGLRTYTNRLSKDEFIECLYSVIEGESYYEVSQRVPYKVPFISVKLRKIAKELNIEAELDESLYIQKITRARQNGAKNKKRN